VEISLQSHRYITFSDYVTHMQAIGGMRGIKGMLWETSLLDPEEACSPIIIVSYMSCISVVQSIMPLLF
jgi:hypothetical protein